MDPLTETETHDPARADTPGRPADEKLHGAHADLTAHAVELFDRQHVDGYVALIGAIMGALLAAGVIKPPKADRS